MIRWAKLIEETKEYCKFGYSLGQNKTCDGILIQDKKDGKFSIERLSDGADTINTGRICCPIVQSIKAGRFKTGINGLQTG